MIAGARMTYSIVARDPATGELGVAVQSRYFGAGRTVPWIEAGVGVIASQAFASPAYGHDGLRMLRAGGEPRDVLEQLLAADPERDTRQVAMLDGQGRVAVHTGTRCVAEAGHAVGANCSAQANMMARNTVWAAMVAAFEQAPGALADRLLAAMEAAEREGGDIRGRQAAALIVVAGQPSGIARADHLVDLRTDDHPDPVAEIRRLLAYSRAHLRANRATRQANKDPAAALAELDACCAAFPDDPDFLGRRALVLLPLGRVAEARAALERARAVQPGAAELILRLADAGILPVDRRTLEPFVVGLAAGPAGPGR
jgi:uncharacterized Ntn-hydrolase superfamily protein